jgi:tRNA(fMet)-specific endonuclease VapC
MNYLLDTNICIHFFRGKYNLFNKFNEVGFENCAISEITLAELVFGAENSSNPQKNHKILEQFIENITIIPIFDSIKKYGTEKVRLRKQGVMISDFDLLIGCTAVEKNMIMVSENTSEFIRIKDIRLENWVTREN